MTKSMQKMMKQYEGLRLPELQARFAEIVGEPSRSPNRVFLLRRIREALDARRQGEEGTLVDAQPGRIAAGAARGNEARSGTGGGPTVQSRGTGPEAASAAEHGGLERTDGWPLGIDEGPPVGAPTTALGDVAEGDEAVGLLAPTAEALGRPPSVAVAPAGPKPAKAPRGRFAGMTTEELQAKYLEVVGRPSDSVARGYLIWKIRQAEKGRIPVGPRTPALRTSGREVMVLPLRLPVRAVEAMDAAWRAYGARSRMKFLRNAVREQLVRMQAHEAAALIAERDGLSAD